jgi:hypothetical protein
VRPRPNRCGSNGSAHPPNTNTLDTHGSGINPLHQSAGPRFDLVTTGIERTVTEEEFAIADVETSIGICVKGTSTTNLLMKDANPATPSQPCPPAWFYVQAKKGGGGEDPADPAEPAQPGTE